MSHALVYVHVCVRVIVFYCYGRVGSHVHVHTLYMYSGSSCLSAAAPKAHINIYGCACVVCVMSCMCGDDELYVWSGLQSDGFILLAMFLLSTDY